MTRVLFLSLSFCYCISANSKCIPDGLRFWPNEYVLAENSIIVVKGILRSAKIIDGLGRDYKIYLQSKNSKIELEVVHLYQGYACKQAVLKPSSDLMPQTEYELVIDNLGDDEDLLQRTHPKTGRKSKVCYFIAQGKDLIPPKWLVKPRYLYGISREMGCGPMTEVYFSYAATDDSPFLVKTTMTSKTTGVAATFLISPEKVRLTVGHGMCSGSFSFNFGSLYEIEFSLIDASGTETKHATEAIAFSRPKTMD